MDSPSKNQLHVIFLPYMAQGHLIPMVDTARFFAKHGVKATIVTTPLNALLFSKTIEIDQQMGIEISIQTLKFPCVEAGLPEGCENQNSLTSPEMIPNFLKAISLLQHPLQELLEQSHPDCLVADMIFTWSNQISNNLGIPRLIFYGTSFFGLCVWDSIRRFQPFKNSVSESEPFSVPGLPHHIQLIGLQIPKNEREGTETEISRMLSEIIISEKDCYGVLMNSFEDLEPDYSQHFKKNLGRKAWTIGPVSLCNRDNEDKSRRGNVSSIDKHECLNWLDSKEPNSVLYLCFGSMSNFSSAQLLEIAEGIEASGQQFIWVVRNESKEEKWLPEGFEKRIEGKGLIVRGWAPQVLILDHEAVGGFVTHCGWNSILEGLTAGVPMVTWPLYAEQHYNEKLVTEVLKVGVEVGAKEWGRWANERSVLIKRENVAKALSCLMVGDEAKEMRKRVSLLKEMAKRAVEIGGSSYCDLHALLEEIRVYPKNKNENPIKC